MRLTEVQSVFPKCITSNMFFSWYSCKVWLSSYFDFASPITLVFKWTNVKIRGASQTAELQCPITKSFYWPLEIYWAAITIKIDKFWNQIQPIASHSAFLTFSTSMRCKSIIIQEFLTLSLVHSNLERYENVEWNTRITDYVEASSIRHWPTRAQ